MFVGAMNQSGRSMAARVSHMAAEAKEHGGVKGARAWSVPFDIHNLFEGVYRG
jgi:hypothetical protein